MMGSIVLAVCSCVAGLPPLRPLGLSNHFLVAAATLHCCMARAFSWFCFVGAFGLAAALLVRLFGFAGALGFAGKLGPLLGFAGALGFALLEPLLGPLAWAFLWPWALLGPLIRLCLGFAGVFADAFAWPWALPCGFAVTGAWALLGPLLC